MRSATRKRIGERCPTCGRKYLRAIPAKRAKARRGPMRDPKYRRFLASCTCVIAMLPWQEADGVGVSREDFCKNAYPIKGNPNDAAHTQNNGMGSKGPDSSCVPLCRKHHDEYDAGRAAFEKKYGVDMKALAAEHWKRYCVEMGVEADFDPKDDYRK